MTELSSENLNADGNPKHLYHNLHVPPPEDLPTSNYRTLSPFEYGHITELDLTTFQLVNAADRPGHRSQELPITAEF